MTPWDTEVLGLSDTDDLRYQALRRVRRRQLMRRKTIGMALGAIAGAIVAGAVGFYARQPGLGLLLFVLSTATFLLIYLFDLYLMNRDERQDQELVVEVEREVERLREPLTKLKRGQLYRLNDDDQLEEVDPAELRLLDTENDWAKR
jgi:hypothetical protein